jgi:RHS repeat-associated protein
VKPTDFHVSVRATPFALRVVTEQSVPENQSGVPSVDAVATKYYHFDHLGSVTAMSDEIGRVVGQGWGGPSATVLGYDDWGARRNPDGSAAIPASFALQTGHREFTGHEAIPGVGLVNMNGRVYDPEIGRFLSPDPAVQFVADLQSYNRYSYVLNNPMRYTDPTGYLSQGTQDVIVGIYLTVLGAVVCIASEGAACVPYAAAVMGFQTTTALLNGADPEITIGINLTSFMLGMGVGGAASSFELSPMWGVVGGAVTGGVTAALATQATGSGDLGNNILNGCAHGALGAAMALAFQAAGDVISKAAAAKQQGGGGGEGVAGKSKTGGLSDHDPARPGIEVKRGGAALPLRDVYAREADSLTVDVAVGGEYKTMTLRQATALTGREFGVLYYADAAGNVHYRTFEAMCLDPDSINYSWNAGERPLAFIHTHPSEVDAGLVFSMRDVRSSFKDQVPWYLFSTNSAGSTAVVGQSILSYTPSTSVESGYVRQF